MNPPFTRDSLRHDQFSWSEELAIKQREREVLEGQPYRGAGRLHSSGGMFTVLGEKLLKDDEGVLALVLPSVVPTAPGNMALRKYLAERFHVETIVSSHDPRRIYFSENTSIGEILLVCRRWTGPGPKPPTNVVNLAENPPNAFQSLEASRKIHEAIEREDWAPTEFFSIQKVEEERIRRGDWSAVNFLSPFLVEAYRTLKEGNSCTPPPAIRNARLIETEDVAKEEEHSTVPMVPLSELAAVGPAGQRIRDAYDSSEIPTRAGRRALWFHKTDVTQSMEAKADVYIEPKKSKSRLADKYWEQRGRLLLPHRLWLPLAKVGAVTLSQAALGSIWTPCRPYRPEITEALCLYLNSSIGILSLLGDRDNRKPSYPSFSLDTLRSLLVPDFTALDESRLKMMRDCFNRLKGETLLTFPEMTLDPVRRDIDCTVTKALGLDDDWVESVRFGLSREPAVTASSAIA